MKKTIIADDEKLARELIKNLLRLNGAPVEIVGEAATGDAALVLILEKKPDIVFIDIKMPGMSGLEVIERTRERYHEDISFIVITAYGYFEYAQNALRLGAKDILLKPVDPTQFVEATEKLLGQNYTRNILFNKILRYIGEHYMENISLNQCAESFFTSSSNVAHLFRQHCRTTFTQYVNQTRIRKAEELLLLTDLSADQIAEKVGYNNPNYFYKKFKEATGKTPAQYRNRDNWY
ncbi:response regulator transcription factor [Bacilliculturomica massiliensis]|uniref:response regulator transcription factor n=1 Tax=Bacilliculturomica massiliensis TaxID=1917867 RepID=UPI0013EF318C|nr:response regulator [Bacilliculturomica massiliensis]